MLKRLRKILFAILTLTLTFGCFAVPAGASATLYVSPDGSDDAAGTIDSPLATLGGAKERAKTLGGDVTVLFRAGAYTFDETVRFDGTDKAGVTYAAYPGERVTFTAGKAYTGFVEDAVNGVRAFRLDVGNDDFNVLFGETRMLRRPRYPESGYLLVDHTEDADWVNRENQDDFHKAWKAMYVKSGDVPVFHGEQDVVLRILHFWKDEMLTIKRYEPDTGRLEFSRLSSMNVRAGDRYFFENVFEALNEPGEWYLDRADGTLWYVPFEGETAADLTLWGSDLDTMIAVDGCDGLKFENIIFRGNGFRIPRNNTERDLSTQAGYDATPCVSFENCAGIAVKNCEFRDVAACAVFLGRAVSDAAVDSCVFENLGAQAVYIRGENVPADDPAVTRDITVTNCLVNGYGKQFYNAVGVLVIHANSVTVSRNEIHDGYYTAISCGWVWGYAYNVTDNCRIENNLIYDVGQGWLSDMGGIYMLGVQPRTVISGNVIHNVAADPGQGGYGGWGIYLDEGSSGMTVTKNLVYACGSDAYHLHYGADNRIENNIFALSAESQVRVVSRYENHKTADFTRNILLTDGTTPTFSHVEDKKALNAWDNLLWDLTNGAEVYIQPGGDNENVIRLPAAQRRKYLGSTVTASPGFADAARFDFTLSPDSPALALGFEPWDYGEAGTLPGTVIGLDLAGGQTPYNAHSRAQTMRPSRERLAFLRKLFDRLIDFFRRLGSMLGRS